ncbi:DUF4332 domain-containing protein [Candidatus Bathyarchaeota archaeon]|nr:DUF4332 domain-containing protein [Candidatus Bathyarchaeota archaeon]
MRLDYVLYTAAVIFFILTGIFIACQVEFMELYVISTVVLGLLCIGVGYSQRPKPQTMVTVEAPAPKPTPTQPIEAPAVEESATPTAEKTEALTTPLTDVKGIGGKRAAQLKALGISSVEELAKASAEDLASKLGVSPKIVNRWIENAKKIVEKD